MKKTILLSLLAMLLAIGLRAQSAIVWDPFVMSQLVTQHKAQQAELKKIKKNEGQIFAAQTYISGKMAEIKEIEEKMHTRLKNVTAVVKDAKDIVYATKISKDIGKYQEEMINYARDNPALLAVAYNAEKALVDRTADLFTYVYTNALIGGEINLLDNKQRQEIIEHVVNELRIMRGLAYGVSRKMRMASRTGVLEYLNPFHLKYPDQDLAIVNDILNDL
ncbi:MAG: plasmid transfer protein [Thalassobius sp.]|nr:plasmid transfer protein [Thalassovita sp.]